MIKYHHTVLTRGYVKVNHEIKTPYKGRFAWVIQSKHIAQIALDFV